MKCQPNTLAYRACLARRSWRRFSPTVSTPASARIAISSSGTYLVATTIVTPGPISSRTRARFARTTSAESGNDPLPSGPAAVPAVREEKLGLAGGAALAPLDPLDAGRAKDELGREREVEPPGADDP